MKPNELKSKDEALSDVLKEWKTDVTLPPGFQANVWRRIEERQGLTSPSIWSQIMHWIGTALPRPALAVSYVAVLLAIGGTAGWAQARHETARVKDELGDHYVRMLDPYQTPRR